MLALFLTTCMSAGMLAGCGSEAQTGGNVTDEGAQKQETTTADAAGSEAEASAEEGGLVWNEEQQIYELEEEVLNGSVSLKLWVDNEQLAAAVKEGFEAKYPGAVVETEVVSSTESVGKLALEGESGTGADVFIIPHDLVGDAMNSTVIGMMGNYDAIIRDRFLESAVETIDYDGNLFGVPYLTESVALIYNKTLLEQLAADGMVDSAEPAKDMNDIMTLAEKYNDPATNRWTIRWEAGNSYTNHMFVTSFGYELFGPDGTDPDSANFDTQAVVDGLKYFEKFRPYWDVNQGDANWDTTVVEFAKGETPYLICGPWALEEVSKGAEENGFEFGVSKLPMFDGHQPYTFSGVQVVCVSSYSKYPAAARALAMYIGSDEIEAFAYKTLGKLPALKDGSTIEGLNEDAKVQAFMEQAQFSNAMPSIPEVSYFWTAAEGMYRGVWDKTITPEEAAKKAQEDFDALRASGQ